MTQSLELLLDDDSEAAVRSQWQRLIDAGLPSMAGHTGESNRPHVTLAVAQHPLPDDVERSFHDLADELPLDLVPGAPLLFGRGSSRVLCRLVVPNESLLRLQARAVESLRDLPEIPYLRPGHWTPHVTLARRLPLADVPHALGLLGELPARPGQAVAVRRWDSDARRTWELG